MVCGASHTRVSALGGAAGGPNSTRHHSTTAASQVSSRLGTSLTLPLPGSLLRREQLSWFLLTRPCGAYLHRMVLPACVPHLPPGCTLERLFHLLPCSAVVVGLPAATKLSLSTTPLQCPVAPHCCVSSCRLFCCLPAALAPPWRLHICHLSPC